MVVIKGYELNEDGCQSQLCYMKKQHGQCHCGSCSCLNKVDKKDYIEVRKELLRLGYPK